MRRRHRHKPRAPRSLRTRWSRQHSALGCASPSVCGAGSLVDASERPAFGIRSPFALRLLVLESLLCDKHERSPTTPTPHRDASGVAASLLSSSSDEPPVPQGANEAEGSASDFSVAPSREYSAGVDMSVKPALRLPAFNEIQLEVPEFLRRALMARFFLSVFHSINSLPPSP